MAHAGFIANADFSQTRREADPFTGWTSGVSFGYGPVIDATGVARFAESPIYAGAQFQQLFTLPADANTLTFEFRLTTTGGLTSAPIDSFQAALWDSAFNTSFAAADVRGPRISASTRPARRRSTPVRQLRPPRRWLGSRHPRPGCAPASARGRRHRVHLLRLRRSP